MKPCNECVYYQKECDGTQNDYNERVRNIDYFDDDCFMSQERKAKFDELIKQTSVVIGQAEKMLERLI